MILYGQYNALIANWAISQRVYSPSLNLRSIEWVNVLDCKTAFVYTFTFFIWIKHFSKSSTGNLNYLARKLYTFSSCIFCLFFGIFPVAKLYSA